VHPILFKFGPITLYSYGLFLALGFLAAITLSLRRASQSGIDPRRIQNLGLLSLLAGLVGARLTYVALDWDSFRSDPWEIIKLHHGGLVFYGGVASGLLAGMGYLRRCKLPVVKTLDLLVPALVLGHAIGRIGCFLNGCCRGKPTGTAFGVAFPPEGIACHPTQLYESAALFLLFFFLLTLQRRKIAPGTMLLAYGLVYGIWRFGIEFLRDNLVFAFGLTAFQWMSLPLVIGCGWALLARKILTKDR